MKSTKAEILQSISNLQEAMLESMESSIAVEEAQLRSQRAHKRLILAQEAIRAIKYTV